MSDPSPAACPICGADSPVGAPGACPRCLMRAAMEPTVDAAGGRWEAPAVEAVQDAFPQLEVLSLIGQGGMGCVFKARQPQLDRFVALKILAPERVDDPRFAERFQREAQALARLSHPHIVTIHDFGQSGGFYFLLMEFVDGVNLRQAMRAGRFTPDQALAIVPPVCEALQYAHERGIVHRDIKPENLLLDREGRVKIADFGIAKIMDAEAPAVGFEESQPAGTPQYMAPEQKQHRATDHRADIYALGVVLYEMLTGELPGANLQPPSRKVQIDVRLDEIVLRALEQNPEMRYETAADLRTRLETFAASPVPGKASRRPLPNTFSVPALVLLLLSAVLCFVAAFFVARNDVRPTLAAAQARLEATSVPRNAAIAELKAATTEDTRRTAQKKVDELSRVLEERQAELVAVARGPSRWSMIWRIAGGVLIAIAGGGMLMRLRRSSVAGTSLENPVAEPESPSALIDERQRLATTARVALGAAAFFFVLALFSLFTPRSVLGLPETIMVLCFVVIAAFAFWRQRFARREPPPLPPDAAKLVGVEFTAAALTVVWWFSAFPVVAFCVNALHIPSSLLAGIILMGMLLPVFGLIARSRATEWVGNQRGRRLLLAWSVVGWVVTLPALGFAAFFFHAMLNETTRWHPAPAEMVIVPLIAFGAVLLPMSAILLGQAQSARQPSPWLSVIGVIATVVVSIAAFSWGMAFTKKAQSWGGLVEARIQFVDVVDNALIVRIVTGEKCPLFDLRPTLESPDAPDAAPTPPIPKEVIFAMWKEAKPGAYVWPQSPTTERFPLTVGSRMDIPLAFILPTPELAQQAHKNLRALVRVEITPGSPQRAVLFDVADPHGKRLTAALRMSAPVLAGDPRWVEVKGLPTKDTATTLEMSWEILTTRPSGTTLSYREPNGGGHESMDVCDQLIGNSTLYQQNVSVLLFKMSDTRVGVRTVLDTQPNTTELDGDFTTLAEEMRKVPWSGRTKPERGTKLELCRIAGQPVLLRVADPPPPTVVEKEPVGSRDPRWVESTYVGSKKQPPITAGGQKLSPWHRFQWIIRAARPGHVVVTNPDGSTLVAPLQRSDDSSPYTVAYSLELRPNDANSTEVRSALGDATRGDIQFVPYERLSRWVDISAGSTNPARETESGLHRFGPVETPQVTFRVVDTLPLNSSSDGRPGDLANVPSQQPKTDLQQDATRRESIRPEFLKQPPDLAFIAWQPRDLRLPNEPVYRADGTLADSPAEKALLEQVRPVTRDEGAKNPDARFVHFWFSHPLFDSDSLVDLSLTSGSGDPVPDTVSASCFNHHTESGWIMVTRSPGPVGVPPKTVHLKLRYVIGPLREVQECEVRATSTTMMSLHGGSELGGYGQTANGRAFLTISVNRAGMTQQQFAVEAVLKDGRKLTGGVGQSGAAGDSGVGTMRFEFDVAIATVAKFRIGVRDIQSKEWRDVALPPRENSGAESQSATPSADQSVQAIQPASGIQSHMAADNPKDEMHLRVIALESVAQAVRTGDLHILHEPGVTPRELTHDPETGYPIRVVPVGDPRATRLFNEAMRAHFRDQKAAKQEVK